MAQSQRVLPTFWQWLLPVFIIIVFAGSLYATFTALEPDEHALNEKAQYHFEQGEYRQAAEVWRQLIAQQPENAGAAYHLGQLSLLLDSESAEGYFNQAARLSPAYEEPAQRFLNMLRLADFSEDKAYRYTLYGQALAAEEDWRLAKEAFLHATEINPDYSEAWAYLGQSRLQLGEEGLPALEEAIKLNPDSLAANVFMGAYWRNQAEPEIALPFLQKAVSLEPKTTSLLTDLGFTLAASGDITAAIEQFQTIIEIAPDDLDTWVTITEFSLDHDLQVAEIGLPAARQALLLAPERATTLVLMARAYSQQGDNFVALRFFNRALQTNSEYAAAHYYLGLHHLAHDNAREAERELNKAIELDKDGELSQQAEAILHDYFQ